MSARTTLPARGDYEAVRREFRWSIPAAFNMADACLFPPGIERSAAAIRNVLSDGRVEDWSYAALAQETCRLANALAAHGIGRGDRIAVLLPQLPETPITHFAAWKLGAISVPMAVLFGPDALRYRLQDCGASVLVTTRACAARITAARHELPDLRLVVSVDGAADGALAWADFVGPASDSRTTLPSAPDDPALMIYTSGTTGPPKGALHGHRVLLGHLPGIEMGHDFFPQPATCSGRRPTGRGRAGCSIACSPRSISGCRSSPRAARNSIQRLPSR